MPRILITSRSVTPRVTSPSSKAASFMLHPNAWFRPPTITSLLVLLLLVYLIVPSISVSPAPAAASSATTSSTVHSQPLSNAHLCESSRRNRATREKCDPHASDPACAVRKRPILFISRGGGGHSDAAAKYFSDTTMDGAGAADAAKGGRSTIGGGAINEKERYIPPLDGDAHLRASVPSGKSTQEDANKATTTATATAKHSTGYDPITHKSHLLHALEGLDRYPNYLLRWSTEDIQSLEAALQQQLRKVQQQKERLAIRQQFSARITQQLHQQILAEDGSKSNPSSSDGNMHAKWTLRDILQPPTAWDDVFQHILHPDCAKAIQQSKTFRRNRNVKRNGSVPSIEDVISGKMDVELDVSQLVNILDEELMDVFAFPLLSQHFCALLQQYAERFMTLLEEDSVASRLQSSARSNIDDMGLSWFNDLMFHLILRPMTQHLFVETELPQGDLDWRHGFIAAYSADPTSTKPRQRLVPHTDDAEVTLNICVGSPAFTGGKLQFYGLRGTSHAGQRTHAEEDAYVPRIGRAIVHAGRQLHEVTQITQGDRFAYIMWARSWGDSITVPADQANAKGASSKVGLRSRVCSCCWLNRRQDNSCICGRRWN